MPREHDIQQDNKEETREQAKHDESTDTIIKKRTINPALIQSNRAIVMKIPIPSSKPVVSTSSSTSSSFIGSVFGPNEYPKRYPSTPEFAIVKVEQSVTSKKRPFLKNAIPKSISVSYPQIGKLAPTFHGTAVVDGEFKRIKLSDYSNNILVLHFYPSDFTNESATQIIGLSERAEELQEFKCRLVGVSTDSEYSHQAWVRTPLEDGGLASIELFPLLADKNNKISQSFGVYLKDTGLAQRSLFIIDGKYIIRHVFLVDSPGAFNMDEIVRLVQDLHCTDYRGTARSTGSKPGDDSTKSAMHSSKGSYQKDC